MRYSAYNEAIKGGRRPLLEAGRRADGPGILGPGLFLAEGK